MKTDERPGSTLKRFRSRFVITDLVPDAACGGVNEDSGEAWVSLNAFSFQICLYSLLTSFQMWPVEGSMKTEERPVSALTRSRSRFVCTDLVPDAACGGVNEDRGEAWVCFNAFSLLMHHAAHKKERIIPISCTSITHNF